MISISVVIPTYNRAASLPAAINSVLNQAGQGNSYEISEVIVIDDCSTDNTAEVIESLNDNRIIYKKLESNGGAGNARNQGVCFAKNPLIAFHDSDDIWMSNKLETQVKYLLDNPDCDMVVTGYKALIRQDEVINAIFQQPDDPIQTLSLKNIVDAPTILISKSSYESIGGFDVNMKALEDWDLAIRFCDQYKICVVPEMLLESDLRSSGVSSNAGNYYNARCQMIVKNMEILKKHGTLEAAVTKLFNDAENDGALEMTKKLLELHIQNYQGII